MQFQFKMKIGQVEFTFVENAATHKEFFEKVAFYASLPKTGPNGEDDLRVEFRSTREGYTYYSLVSDAAGQEYMFGQAKDNPGELFPKGWQAKYVPEQNAENSNGIQPQVYQEPVQQAPIQQQVVPQTQPPVQQQQVGQGVSQAPQVTSAPPAQSTTNPQANNQAADILKNFGIN